MPVNTTSPNMSLIIPTVGQEAGPTYAFDINSSLTLIDQHDHTPGKGVQITPDGLNINRDLQFNGFKAIGLGGMTMIQQTSPPGLNTLYEDNTGNLSYVDSLGNVIQLTINGTVFPPTTGDIIGLVAPAQASYSPLTKTFYWQSNSSIPLAANMDFAAAILRNSTPNSTFGLTLQPPTMVSNYTITLPILPSVDSFLTIGNGGTILASPALLGALTTLNLSSSANIIGTQLSPTANILGTQIASATITGSNIASATIEGSNIDNLTITGSNIVDATIGAEKLAVSNVIVSGSSGAFNSSTSSFVTVTNFNVPISVVPGRLIKMCLISDGSGNPSAFGSGGNGSTFRIVKDGVPILDYAQTPTPENYYDTSWSAIDPALPTVAATITYQIQVSLQTGGAFSVFHMKFVVWQD